MLIELATSSLKKSKSNDVEDECNKLQKFSFKILTYQIEKSESQSASTPRLEKTVSDFVVAFMCRLSETSFRRVFLKVIVVSCAQC